MDIVGLYDQAAEEFQRRLSLVRSDCWNASSACSEWTVRDVANHVVSESLWVPDLFDGKTVEEVGEQYDGDVSGDDPVQAFHEASTRARAAIRARGAMQKTVHLSYGEELGRTYTGQLFIDLVLHAWDVAEGIGEAELLDPELVQACYDEFAPQAHEWRRLGAVGPALHVPDGADPQAQLLALAGRRSSA